MLRSELFQLEKLVAALLENLGTGGGPATEKSLNLQVKQLTALCADLKTKWVHELFSTAKEQIITRYVQFHQAGITQLSNTIQQAVTTGNMPPVLFEQALAELDELLKFLKDQCYRYFDLDYQMTAYNCSLHLAQINQYTAELIAYETTSVDDRLMGCLAASVLELTGEAIPSGMSYRQGGHFRNLLVTIEQQLRLTTTTTTGDIALILYKQNFNTLYFVNWYRAHLQSQIDLAGGKQEKETFILQLLKTFADIFVDPEKAFETELPGTEQAITGWLKALTGSPIGKGNQVQTDLRLPLTVSVPQFALFIRIFSQAGCFPDTRVSQITRFFTQHFRTKKQSNISSKSFARAFYSLDQSAAAVVRDYLQKMINYVNKTYFP